MKKSAFTRVTVLGPKVALATTKKEYNAIMDELNLPRETKFLTGKAIAHCETITGDVGCVFVVSMRPSKNEHQMLSQLVHECVHVKQRWYEWIEEPSPGKESEAYLLEAVFAELHSQLTKKLKKD